MGEIEKIRKKIKKEAEESFEIDENSDMPVHERYAREEDIKKTRKK